MKRKPEGSQPAPTKLRRRAEQQLRKQGAPKLRRRTSIDAQRLVHELQVHQIELEMQNAELRRAHDEIKTALTKITNLYDFAPVAYFTLDREGKIHDANLAGAATLGVDRSALSHQHLSNFVVPPELTAFNHFLDEVFSAKSRRQCEVSLSVKTRPTFPAELNAAMAESGELCRVVLTDISERKRLEEARLVLSKLESTGILAGGIAHDFNNLLATISLGLDLALYYGSSSPQVQDCLNEVKKAVACAQQLTQQFIIFSEGGEPTIERCALQDLLRESIRLALVGSDVKTDVRLPADLWPVVVDVNQIGRVVHNLVLNAREAMPHGGVITIRAENFSNQNSEIPELPSGVYVRTIITDQGVGIEPENLAKIFDPYFSTKRRGEKKGMGLGLTTSHTIIKKHGGAIFARSKLNEGTTMEFYLPASASASAGGPVTSSGRDVEFSKS